MECPLCGKDYQGVEIPKELWNNSTDELCPQCISDRYEHDMARDRANRIPFYKELILIDETHIGRVLVGNVEVECSGYYADGELYDQFVTINGRNVFGLLDEQVQDMIDAELIRRVKSGAIIKRINEIEQELPDSQDPATLRLERSKLDGQLEEMEATG